MNPLARKLEHFTRLTAADKAVLDDLAALPHRTYAPHTDIVREGEPPRVMRLILSGWACHYKMLEDGRRQIVGFVLPGDLCDLNVPILRAMDHALAAITAVSLVEVSTDTLGAMTLNHPRLLRGLWWETLVREEILREWTLNLGQRDSLERTAHLLCELFVRLECVGLADGPKCPWPLTQTELADTLGISTAHTNRVLQELRTRGLIILRNRTLTIPDLKALQRVALFNPNYLHLEREVA
ncbi:MULTISPECIES: Crp/Fnr family transcriptional regulator [Methylobacteriaceae]|jgi:CRP-like cAMP-binding protein|uniref:Crp/Fnr family transcriptional regulator n=8 Tax=Pseudomonadota TaxID=1224 RepID=A0ABU9ZKI2_9HYPH|nr:MULTISPECIES: Crp/Fnr family transcriptional regulator [Methylobacteriaceae]MBY0143896.1 Crp/Fnr family transcriptional regulator [Methylorubrum populi]MCX7329917.1 Crp/Fnr family transcriptional regulator [Hyphomicrobiales bacterium]MBB5760881.1 CRP-like cAMP-binding protein [Methylorubrum rhodesianum]MBI1691016.1 Crp/Fnr family transcriptional regulator [Methylorubrum sp. DB1722]MBK3402292.1 Crp/Fnr family transcriptional regulator [Methylorubrum rhodesianum]